MWSQCTSTQRIATMLLWRTSTVTDGNSVGKCLGRRVEKSSEVSALHVDNRHMVWWQLEQRRSLHTGWQFDNNNDEVIRTVWLTVWFCGCFYRWSWLMSAINQLWWWNMRLLINWWAMRLCGTETERRQYQRTVYYKQIMAFSRGLRRPLNAPCQKAKRQKSYKIQTFDQPLASSRVWAYNALQRQSMHWLFIYSKSMALCIAFNFCTMWVRSVGREWKINDILFNQRPATRHWGCGESFKWHPNID